MRQIFFSVLVAMAIALAGAGDALAKAKSGSGSFGSRGSRTFDRPMENTLTPPSSVLKAPSAPSASQRPSGPPPMPQAAPRGGSFDSAPLPPAAAPGTPMYRPGALGSGAPMAPAPSGFAQRNPFMAGMVGGLVGAGIGSMLFGHSPALAGASEMSPAGSMFGTLLQFALIVGGIWFVVRLLRRRAAAAAPQVNPYIRASVPEVGGARGHIEPVLVRQPPRVDKEFEAAGADQQAFTEILLGVQKAWSENDLAQLKLYGTPEIVSWLSMDLSRNASRGVINKVENVALVKGDVSESWHENGLDYLTAMLTFSCVDYMVQVDSGKVVEGDPRTPVQHTEAWTFVRSSGGRWLLSAVEQA
jgi:predicted lipid-binding transport protein (Tim44 family)